MDETTRIGSDRAAQGKLLFDEALGLVDVLVDMIDAVFLDNRGNHRPGDAKHITQVQFEGDRIGVSVPERSARFTGRTEVSLLFF